MDFDELVVVVLAGVSVAVSTAAVMFVVYELV